MVARAIALLSLLVAASAVGQPGSPSRSTTEEQAVGDNLSRINILYGSCVSPFPVSFPADPVTTSERVVSRPRQLNSALGNGRKVTINAGNYGGFTVNASDVDLIVSDEATFSGAVTINGSRVRMTGGNLTYSHSGSQYSEYGLTIGASARDVLIDGVVVEQGLISQAADRAIPERIAVINSTIRSRQASYGAFLSIMRHVVFANTSIRNTAAAHAGIRAIALQGFSFINGEVHTVDNRIIRIHGGGPMLPAYDHFVCGSQLSSSGPFNVWLGPAAGGPAGRIDRIYLHHNKLYYSLEGLGGGWLQVDANVAPGIGLVSVIGNEGYSPDRVVRTGPAPGRFIDDQNVFGDYRAPPAFTGGARR